MAIFVGFSTQNAGQPRPPDYQPGVDGGAGSFSKVQYYGKKYRITDEDAVIQSFINALNIPLGQKPGQPSYGTILWNFIFEPNVPDTQFQIQNEIRRIAGLDDRLILNSVVAYPQENGILIEVELAVAPFNNAQSLSIFFDQNANRAFGV
jgi:phage baseplate assembly protein W